MSAPWKREVARLHAEADDAMRECLGAHDALSHVIVEMTRTLQLELRALCTCLMRDGLVPPLK